MFKLACLLALLGLGLVSATSTHMFRPREFDTSPQCNGTLICAGLNGNCSASGNADVAYQCGSGLFCSGTNPTCQLASVFAGTCSGTQPCYDPNGYSITCSSGTCKYASIYYPGETCSTSANYVNGGCIYGSCSTTCTAPAASGAACGGTNQPCAYNSYCDPASATCKARLASAAACNNTYQCQANLICTNRGSGSFSCQAPFAGASGAACADYQDCGAGLFCSGNKCTAPTGVGANCLNNAGQCSFSSGTECVCSASISGNVASNNGATCQGIGNSQADINAYTNLQSCLSSHQCYDLQHQIGTETIGPNSCASQCISRSYAFGSCFSDASALLPMIALVVLAVAALLL